MSSHIEKRNQLFKVRDTEITILANALVDDETNEIIFDRQLDNAAINLAFDQYRLNNNIVSSQDIINFRKKYKLSQRSLSILLNVSSATISRYEKGVLPSESINNLFKQIMSDDVSFMELFNQNKNNLLVEDKQKVESAFKLN